MKMNLHLLDIQQYWQIRLQNLYIVLWILWNIYILTNIWIFFSCSEIDSRQRSVQQTASRFNRHHLQKLASTGRVTWSYKNTTTDTLSEIHAHIYNKLGSVQHASLLIPPFLSFVDWNRWAFSRWWECHSWIPVYKGLPGKFLCLSTQIGKKNLFS